MKKTATLLFVSLFSLSLFSQNQALHFDGPDDYVAVPANTAVLTGGSFTCEVWVKPTAFGDFNTIVSKGSSNSTFLLMLRQEPEIDGPYPTPPPYVSILMDDGSTSEQVQYFVTNAWLNHWHHLAATYDGSSITLYVDGTPAGTQAFSGTLPLNAGDLRIGASFGNDLVYAGTMDELRIWSTVRTQAQIQASMNAEINPATPGLVAYYRFNQGTAEGDNRAITTLTDLASFPTQGTLTNFARIGSTSNFTTGYGSLVVLPVKEGSFTATKKQTAVQLNWKGLYAGNRSVFQIERSTNALDFSTIGSVQGSASPTEAFYTFLDAKPSPSVNYYRIKTFDAAGQATYSNTVAVKMNGGGGALQVYPNPATALLQVQVTAPKGTLNLQVKDVAGRTVQTRQLSSEGNTAYTSLDVSRLPAGTYFLFAGSERVTFIKQR